MADSFFDSARRQRLRAYELFEQLDCFGVPWNLFDGLFMIFWQQRRRIVGSQFFVFAKKLGIPIGFAKSFLENLYAIFGRSWGENKRGAGNPESALQLNDFPFSIRFSKALNLGQRAEPWMRMLIPLGSFHDRMDLHQVFFEPLAVTLEQRVGTCGSPIDFPTLQSRIELGAAVSGDELRVFQTKHIGEEAAFIVGRKANGLRANS